MEMSWSYTATGGNFSKRVEEKQELQHLNDRFASYIARVRQLREQSGSQIDAASFIQSIKILEDEIRQLKVLYEGELEKIRARGDGLKKEYSALHLKYEKSFQLNGELRGRFEAEAGKSGALAQQVSKLNTKITQIELRCRNAEEGAGKPHAELEKLRGELKRALGELSSLNIRYEQEVIARQDGDNKAKGALEKLRVAEQVHAKQLLDLTARLDAANAAILEMERKAKGSRVDVDVKGVIKQVRDAADTELTKFKAETNEKYGRNLDALKGQIGEYMALIDKLAREKQAAAAEAESFRLKHSKLEGQIGSMRSEMALMETHMAEERRAAAAQLHAVSGKMKEFQNQMFSKIAVSGGTSNDSVMLAAEIKALKALLEEEEKRLQSAGGKFRPSSSLSDINWKTSGSKYISADYSLIGPEGDFGFSTYNQGSGDQGSRWTYGKQAGGTSNMGFVRNGSARSNEAGGTSNMGFVRNSSARSNVGDYHSSTRNWFYGSTSTKPQRTEYRDSYKVKFGRPSVSYK